MRLSACPRASCSFFEGKFSILTLLNDINLLSSTDRDSDNNFLLNKSLNNITDKRLVQMTHFSRSFFSASPRSTISASDNLITLRATRTAKYLWIIFNWPELKSFHVYRERRNWAQWKVFAFATDESGCLTLRRRQELSSGLRDLRRRFSPEILRTLSKFVFVFSIDFCAFLSGIRQTLPVTRGYFIRCLLSFSKNMYQQFVLSLKRLRARCYRLIYSFVHKFERKVFACAEIFRGAFCSRSNFLNEKKHVKIQYTWEVEQFSFRWMLNEVMITFHDIFSSRKFQLFFISLERCQSASSVDLWSWKWCWMRRFLEKMNFLRCEWMSSNHKLI